MVAQVLKVFNCLLIVFMPPPGAGGGSERLTGHGPSASEGRVQEGAKRGKGWGLGTLVAQVLKVLRVCLLYLCPLREREGAASCLTGHVPSASEGRVRADAKRGKGRG